MNDLIGKEHAVMPVVYRRSVHGIARQLIAPISGWDTVLSSLQDRYREA